MITKIRVVFLWGGILLFFCLPIQAQHSLVPATHQVYDWLLYQRVSGNLSNYDHESIPLTRGQITILLKELEKKENDLTLKINLNRTDRNLLANYLLEFDFQRMGEKEFYKTISNKKEPFLKRVVHVLTDYTNPNVFTYLDTTRKNNASLTFRYGLNYLTAEENPTNKNGLATFKGMQAFGTFNDLFGVHFEVDNIAVTGGKSNWRLLSYMPQYAYSHSVQWQKKNVSQSYENFISLYSGVIGLDMGSGSLKMGVAVTDPLLFSVNAANFNWIRFTIRMSWLTFTSVHGSLYAATRNEVIVVGKDTALTRYAPNRWITAHRLTLRPAKWIEVSLFEQLAYSNRNAEYAYLNPINPYFYSELDIGSRDNAVVGGDIIIRPFKGTELFSTIYIDDLVGFSSIFKDEPMVDDDVAMNVGLYQVLPFSLRFGASYTRIEPFVYTHWQRLNILEQRGVPLGHHLGPNSDELAFQLKKYFPYRTWVTTQVSFVRKGFNIAGASNTEEENAGGDLFLGNSRIGKRLFQDSDLHVWTEILLEAQTEPIRGLILSGRLQKRMMQRGTQIGDFTFTELKVNIGF